MSASSTLTSKDVRSDGAVTCRGVRLLRRTFEAVLRAVPLTARGSEQHSSAALEGLAKPLNQRSVRSSDAIQINNEVPALARCIDRERLRDVNRRFEAQRCSSAVLRY